MSCTHCCGADKLFDDKSAKKDLKRYLKRGPKKPTRLLVEALKKQNLQEKSLLDIGGGIGPIPLELIPEGITKVTDIDSSASYINIAESEAIKRGYKDIIQYQFGDFVDQSKQIEIHDIVTLDKVICCYPHVDDLLKSSLSKAKKYYGIVYPQTNWLSSLWAKSINLGMWIKKNPFRTFIHPTKLVDSTILNAGFKKVSSINYFLSWQIHLYEKI
ncbi:MAG: methyltransferase [Urechidicola sp.]|nr:methyltransferase [Urechidicola sp.]